MARRESSVLELAVDVLTDLDPIAQRAVPEAKLTRRYVGEAGRQVHLIEGGRAGASRSQPPLACFHATPASVASLAPFLNAMAGRRHVLALDTPGYGASDPPARRQDIAGYATLLGEALDQALDGRGAADVDTRVDLFGYSTGALIAVELARQRPERVRRLIMMSVPYFVGAEQAVWRHRLARPPGPTDDLNRLEARWRALVIDREWGVSVARGLESFVDEVRAYPHDWWAHDAAFGYDVETAFAEVGQPVLVLNPADALAQASRRAAWALPEGQLVELPLLHKAPFDLGADELAERVDDFLRRF